MTPADMFAATCPPAVGVLLGLSAILLVIVGIVFPLIAGAIGIVKALIGGERDPLP